MIRFIQWQKKINSTLFIFTPLKPRNLLMLLSNWTNKHRTRNLVDGTWCTPQCCQYKKFQTLQLQPLQTWTQAPTISSRVIILKIHLPAIFYDIETEGLPTVTHGYTSYWHNWDCVPLTYDPCSGRYLCSFSNDIRRKLVQKIRICKKGWCALVCLSVAQFHPFGPIENLIWYWSCSTRCIYFPSWKSLPVTAQTLVF